MAYQISKEEFLNPIKQDIKKGKLRFVRNCFPHKGYLWNYGAFPRVGRFLVADAKHLTDCDLSDVGRSKRGSPRNQSQG
jgi:inorganic pyrophosphatase